VHTDAIEAPMVAALSRPAGGRASRFEHSRLARALSLQQAGASQWLTAIPTRAPLKMGDSDFRYAVRHRLAMAPLDFLPPACPCGELAVTTDHAHVCSLNKRAWTVRHNGIVRTLERLATDAGYIVQHELGFAAPAARDGAAALAGADNAAAGELRPDCLLIGAHKTVAIDVSVICPTAASYVRPAARTALAAAHVREAMKLAKYDALCAAHGWRMVPFVMESYGAFGRRALDFLGTMLAYATEQNQPFVLKRARQELAVALQRGNAWVALQACVSARVGGRARPASARVRRRASRVQEE
jgi:hypothetical protein